jgi:chromate reductase, NAD(P)H dehydrogenase (quinone)
MHRVSVLVGSLRRDSINRKFARALEKLADGRLEFDYPDLNLPLYNQDLWDDPPAAVPALKRSVGEADAVLFVTPEYNRSFTPAIKNAIDWGSRPTGQSSWPGKPAGITGASPGQISTAVAQSQLRSIVVGQGMILMGQPAMHMRVTEGLIDGDFRFTDPKTEDFAASYVEKFDAWIARMKATSG